MGISPLKWLITREKLDTNRSLQEKRLFFRAQHRTKQAGNVRGTLSTQTGRWYFFSLSELGSRGRWVQGTGGASDGVSIHHLCNTAKGAAC